MCGQRGNQQEGVGDGSVYAVLDDGAPDLQRVLEVLGCDRFDELFDVVVIGANE